MSLKGGFPVIARVKGSWVNLSNSAKAGIVTAFVVFLITAFFVLLFTFPEPMLKVVTLGIVLLVLSGTVFLLYMCIKELFFRDDRRNRW